MGRIFTVELEGKVYTCKYCRTPLVRVYDLVSQAYQCRTGSTAYLFNNGECNFWAPKGKGGTFWIGVHTVADIFCCCCGQLLGWKYLAIQDSEQKYKEGLFVLGRKRIYDEIDAELHGFSDAAMMSTDDEQTEYDEETEADDEETEEE